MRPDRDRRLPSGRVDDFVGLVGALGMLIINGRKPGVEALGEWGQLISMVMGRPRVGIGRFWDVVGAVTIGARS